MHPTDQKLNDFLIKNIADNVDTLGNFLQKLMIEAYQQGYNDALEVIEQLENAPNKAYVLGYRSKLTGMDYMRGRDGKFYPTESGDFAGLDKSFFIPSEWEISMIVTDKNVVKEIENHCFVDGVKYTIYSFTEKAEGEILAGIGPTMSEYLDKSEKKMKVVNVNQLD